MRRNGDKAQARPLGLYREDKRAVKLYATLFVRALISKEINFLRALARSKTNFLRIARTADVNKIDFIRQIECQAKSPA